MELDKKQIRNKLAYLKRSGQTEKYLRYLKRYRDIEDYIIPDELTGGELTRTRNFTFYEEEPKIIKKTGRNNERPPFVFFKNYTTKNKTAEEAEEAEAALPLAEDKAALPFIEEVFI